MFNVDIFFKAFDQWWHPANGIVYRDEVEKLLLEVHAPLEMRKHLPELTYRSYPEEVKAWAVKAAMLPAAEVDSIPEFLRKK